MRRTHGDKYVCRNLFTETYEGPDEYKVSLLSASLDEVQKHYDITAR
jgi:hypothetical protein